MWAPQSGRFCGLLSELSLKFTSSSSDISINNSHNGAGEGAGGSEIIEYFRRTRRRWMFIRQNCPRKPHGDKAASRTHTRARSLDPIRSIHNLNVLNTDGFIISGQPLCKVRYLIFVYISSSTSLFILPLFDYSFLMMLFYQNLSSCVKLSRPFGIKRSPRDHLGKILRFERRFFVKTNFATLWRVEWHSFMKNSHYEGLSLHSFTKFYGIILSENKQCELKVFLISFTLLLSSLSNVKTQTLIKSIFCWRT